MNKQFNRQRRHSNNNCSVRSIALQQITRFTILDSSGPLGKLRGTALQLSEKYQAGAKDAQTQGDVVLFQTCQQYADHYLRLQAIAIENEQAKTRPDETTSQNTPKEAAAPAQAEPSASPKVSAPTPVVVEKKPIVRHKKTAEDILSMPMDALQEKSHPKEASSQS